MPRWIHIMNFVSARLRRCVTVLLVLAAAQAVHAGVAMGAGEGNSAHERAFITNAGLRSSLD